MVHPEPMRSYQLVEFGSPLVEIKGGRPVPTGTEVILRVVASGVCHSDLHLCEGEHDLGGGRKISLAGRLPLPMTPGHEIAGEVVAVGPDAEGVGIGQSFLACSWIGCLECDACSVGNEHLCRSPRFLGVNRNGGYADFVTVPHPRNLIPLRGLDPRQAAPLVCSGLTTYSALKKLRGTMDVLRHRIIVIGAGGLGLMALQILKMLGGVGAVVVEIDPAKREAALAAGAIAALDPAESGAAKAIRSAVGGDVLGVVDFVGSGDTAKLGFDLLGQGGKLIVVGLFGGAMTIPVPLLPMKSAQIHGSYIGSPTELRELIDLVLERGMPKIPLDMRPLSEVNKALADLQKGQVVGRVILVPSGSLASPL
jgi:propanol-preferring alcohol dehydrogenase